MDGSIWQYVHLTKYFYELYNVYSQQRHGENDQSALNNRDTRNTQITRFHLPSSPNCH